MEASEIERPAPLAPRPRRFLAVAPWPRALVETLLVAALLVAISFLAQGQTAGALIVASTRGTEIRLLLTVMLLVGPAGCALWLALRLRMTTTRWYRALPGEALFGVLLALAPSAILLFLLTQYASRNPARTETYTVVWLIISAIFAASFIVYRIGVRVWFWWDGVRRRSLRWALTHALLSVAAGGAALVGLSVLGLTLALTRPGAALLQWITALIFLSALTIIAMFIALPPAAFFSYLFARGASRRILSLVRATERLRMGDYSARAPVEGEDEVAQLQRNFNAMAADLEAGVQALRAERDRVARLLEQRRELVASVSHELRTPVASLRGYLESASMRWDESSPGALRRDLDVMLHETERLQGLIDDLFTLSRAEVGRLDLTPEAVDVAALARRVVETVAPLAWRESRVEVVARVAPETPRAWADATRMEQALHNLLRNAMRHTPPGGIIVTLVERAEVDGAAWVALRVRDTGEGIAAEDLPHIWERFYRSSRARELDSNGGSGLGLALVKEVVEAMGGAVSVESAPGEGSSFSLLLPLAGATREAATTRDTGAPAPERAGLAAGSAAGSAARSGAGARDGERAAARP